MELRGCYPEHVQSSDYKIIEIRLHQNAYLALQYCITSQNETHLFTYKDSWFHQVISELSGNHRRDLLLPELFTRIYSDY